jgi:ribosomal protein S18 acetylase RimI-like enzyme
VPRLDPRFVKAARAQGRLVGFVVAMPNLAEGFRRARGRLLPLGWWHLWRAAHHARQLDLLVGGVAHGWRGRGVDALLGSAVLASARAAGMTVLDSHHVLETNRRMRAEYERLGGEVVKRYRIYGRDIA